jgi:Tol biopolymer transport system component
VIVLKGAVMLTKLSALGTTALAAAFAALMLPTLSQATAPTRNGEIAFSGKGGQVFTINWNGSRLRQITPAHSSGGPGLAYMDASDGLSWSPDGRGLLFVAWEGGGGDEIFKSGADGSGATGIGPPCPSDTCDEQGEPVYSPDGTKIAFGRSLGPIVNGQPSVSAIFTMNADGSTLTQLTQKSSPTSSQDSQPAWSPDGSEIAFVRTNTTATPSDESAIEVMNADGSNIRRLTPFYIDAGNPHWSPNGERILFNTYALQGHGQRPVLGLSANLYTMRPDGTHRVALTHYIGGTQQAFAEDWSPNGTHILFNHVAFSRRHASRGGFYIMDVRTKRTGRLADVRTNQYSRAAWGRRPS